MPVRADHHEARGRIPGSERALPDPHEERDGPGYECETDSDQRDSDRREWPGSELGAGPPENEPGNHDRHGHREEPDRPKVASERSRLDHACSRVRSPAVAATLMDGKALAARVRAEVAEEVEALGRPVGLATVLVGDDPASAIYVRRKREACAEVGHRVVPPRARRRRRPRTSCSRSSRDLNADERVTGILVQLPLPDHIDEGRVIRAIEPVKDVDGFHPANAGLLLQGRPTLVPATPAGIMELLRAYEVELEGAGPSSSGARTSSASRSRSCSWPRTRPSRSATAARATSPRSYARGRRARRRGRARRDGHAATW